MSMLATPAQVLIEATYRDRPTRSCESDPKGNAVNDRDPWQVAQAADPGPPDPAAVERTTIHETGPEPGLPHVSPGTHPRSVHRIACAIAGGWDLPLSRNCLRCAFTKGMDSYLDGRHWVMGYCDSFLVGSHHRPVRVLAPPCASVPVVGPTLKYERGVTRGSANSERADTAGTDRHPSGDDWTLTSSVESAIPTTSWDSYRTIC